jgi:hypothetical protein
MARIHKLSGYLVDPNGKYESEDVEEGIKYAIDVFSQHLKVQTAEIGEWDDDNPLNYHNCDLAQCEKYFPVIPMAERVDGRNVQVGENYRHFKEGKLVKVLAVSQDTENVGSFSVVYECTDTEGNTRIWHRPYEMFVSEVDHKKYPEAKQKYRFEKVV